MRTVKSLFLFLTISFSAFSQVNTAVSVSTGTKGSDAAIPAGRCDTLGSDYNLGRIPSEYLFDNVVGWDQFGDHGLLLQSFSSRSGSTGNFSFGCVPEILLADFVDGLYFFQAMPEFDFLWKIKNSNRLYVSISPLNFWVASASAGGGTGFDMPFTTLQNYQWHFLSQGGVIDLKPENYDLAFLFGPQLNAGQFRSDVSLYHTINADTVPLRIFVVSLSPTVGIHDGLQLEGNFSCSYVDSVTQTYDNYSSDIGSYKSYDKSTLDSIHISLGLQYRNEHFFVDGYCERNWWNYKQQMQIDFGTSGLLTDKYQDYGIGLNAGYLLGSRIHDIGSVQGNWDGFYSRCLGQNQLFSTMGIEAVPKKTDFYYLQTYVDSIFYISRALVDLNQNIRYGIYNHFEIGEQFKANLSSDSTPTYKLGLKLSTNNIPLRTYGPEQASNDEYFHAILLKKSQLYGSITYFLPCFKKVVDYQYLPIYQLVQSYGSSNDISNPFGRNNITNTLDLSQSGNISMLQDADLSLQFSWGITDNISFSDAFEFGSINYKPMPADIYMYPLNPPHATHNSIFSNLSMISFHTGRSTRLIIAVDYASQTDNDGGHASKDEMKNFSILFLAQAAVPSKPYKKN